MIRRYGECPDSRALFLHARTLLHDASQPTACNDFICSVRSTATMCAQGRLHILRGDPSSMLWMRTRNQIHCRKTKHSLQLFTDLVRVLRSRLAVLANTLRPRVAVPYPAGFRIYRHQVMPKYARTWDAQTDDRVASREAVFGLIRHEHDQKRTDEWRSEPKLPLGP